MWTALLDRLLRALVVEGALTVATPDGRVTRYGNGAGPEAHVTLRDPALPRRLILSPEFALGEGYVRGGLEVAGDDLHALLAVILRNRADRPGQWWMSALHGLRRARRTWRQFNPVARARRNVAHHYDLSQALYETFLDADLQYSCAYYRRGGETLEAAQDAKKRHIAAKLLLAPGMRVLDIGCGWGGMAMHLARVHGVRVTGVTLSRDQHRVARARVAAAGLSDRIDIRLSDYRAVAGRFDRIVSVGMFEHVGVPHYREYFGAVRARLTDDGVALIHTIGRMKPPGSTSPWIDRYIFPGGYAPALSEIMAAVERADLWVCDIEVWRLHYARTLAAWQRRFRAGIGALPELDTPEFRRLWMFYLIASEMSFREGGHNVFQVQLSRRQEAVPLSRDYLYPAVPAADRQAAE